MKCLEKLLNFNITNGFEVISVGDIPSTGSGLDPQVLLAGIIKCINSIQKLN